MSWKLYRQRQSLKPTGRTRPRKPQWRPELECLEDRTVPTAVLNLSGPQTLVASTDVNASNSGLSEHEMQVAINPDNPMQVAGFTHGGNGNDMVVLWSEDGGLGWNQNVIDGTDAEDDDGQGPGHRFDPTLKFDANGRLYIAYCFDDGDATRLMTAFSDNGGQTFSRDLPTGPVSTFRSWASSDNLFNPLGDDATGIDKPFLTTGLDPTTGRQAVYIAYTWITHGVNPYPDFEITVVGSNDGGLTHTQPLIIDDEDGSFFAGPAVGPNGELYVVWTDHDHDQIMFDRDLDGLWGHGHDFGDDIALADLHETLVDSPTLDVKKPPANPKRGFTNGPSIDVSRTSPFLGRIYVTYTDTFNGDDTDIYMVSSDTHGDTWEFLTGNPSGQGNVENSTGTDFMATVAVDQTSGSVNVGYYTTAGDQATGNDDVNFRVASSIDGGGHWIRATLSSATSNANAMTNPNEFGDYVGLAAHGGTILGLWTDNREDPQIGGNAPNTEAFAATASFQSATGRNRLSIIGTSAADIIEVMPSSVYPAYVEVVVNARNEYTGLWASLDSIEVYGLGGDDEIYIHHGSFPLPVPISVFGGNDNDAIHVILPLSTSTGLPMGSGITVDGGTGSDTVTLWNDHRFGSDLIPEEDFTYAVTNATVSVAGSTFGGLRYDSMEGLTLRAGPGNDTFNISSTAPGVPVTVNAGEGDDTINLGRVQDVHIIPHGPNLDALKSGVIVNGEEGTDRVNLNDQSATADDAYTISNFGVQRKHTNSKGQVLVTGLTYSTIESLVLNAGRGNNTIKIPSTAAGTPVTVNASAGNDTIYVGNTGRTNKGPHSLPLGNLDLLPGPVTVYGQSGTDVVIVMDQGASPGHDYSISDTELSRGIRLRPENAPQFGGLIYGTIEGLTLNADNGTNSIVVSAATLPVTINGNGASDTLVRPGPDNTWLITGPNRGTVGGVTFAAVENLRGGAGTDVFAFRTLFVTSPRVSSINGDGGTNWLDYSRYLGKVTVNLATDTATGVDPARAFSIQNVIGSRTAKNALVGNDDPLGNILVGGNAADEITAGSARGIIIGGKGPDLITGGSADDIAIGGFTDYDRDRTALQATLGAWLSEIDSYETRIAALRAGISSGGNTYSLIWGSGAGTTVHDDGAADMLLGDPSNSNPPGLDWFFAKRTGAGPRDTIFDLQVGEKVNNQP